jgi:hypothetical protein
MRLLFSPPSCAGWVSQPASFFVSLCETYLAVLLNFSLFKHDLFFKYQPNAAKWQVIVGVGIQTCPYRDFLNLPLKSSLKGWHYQWFYYENHEPGLPSFVCRLPEYDATWIVEPVDYEMPVMIALAS